MTTLDYEHVRFRHEERVAHSLATYVRPSVRDRGCPLERVVRWIASRRRRNFDPALLGR